MAERPRYLRNPLRTRKAYSVGSSALWSIEPRSVFRRRDRSAASGGVIGSRLPYSATTKVGTVRDPSQLSRRAAASSLRSILTWRYGTFQARSQGLARWRSAQNVERP